MVINQDAWRRGWEGNDQFADAAGPLRIGGEKLLTSIESFLSIAAPNHKMTVEPIGSILAAGNVVQWKVVDGAKVWPTLHFAEYWLADPKNRQMFGRWGHGTLTPKAMLDALSMRLRLDLEAAEYVYVDEGIPIASFKRGELVVAP
jgi:hypothetical protein